jgi:hypothetical protein
VGRKHVAIIDEEGELKKRRGQGLDFLGINMKIGPDWDS